MSLHGQKVFIVEYSAFITAQIKGVLEKAGAEVKASHNPGKALLEIVHWHPDAIISNIDIGEITGFDLCLLLKMMPEHAAIPFIILSSKESDIVKEQMVSVGADYYIPKDSRIAVNAYQTLLKVLHKEEEEQVVPADKKLCNRDGVLVVDDSAVIRRIVCNILTTLGVSKIGQAGHGKDALDQLDKQAYSMVLTDWNMPYMNGLELTQTLRARPETRDIPIIMLTTEGAHAERVEAEAAGVNKLVSKPFTRDHFRTVLKDFL
jgi:two-component system chemotaxis response regulator CheY